MRDRCNHDLRFEADPQRETERRMPKAVKGDREQLAAGYATLDQASTEPYSEKERRGTFRDANYSRRY
jgi:hypothetical protein